MIENKIEIDIEEYQQLIENQKFLRALEEMGVDNWEGYTEAVELFDSYN